MLISCAHVCIALVGQMESCDLNVRGVCMISMFRYCGGVTKMLIFILH